MKHEPRFFLQNNVIIDKDGARVVFTDCVVKPDENGFAELSKEGNLLRVQIPWNMVEHDGPDLYNEAFLAGLRDTLKADTYENRTVILEPQFDGHAAAGNGTGMPDWAVSAAGFNSDKLYNASKESQKVADGIMRSLFLYGAVIAPGLSSGGYSIQDFLQDHFIAAMRHTARRLKDLPCIAGCMLPSGIVLSAGVPALPEHQLEDILLPADRLRHLCVPDDTFDINDAAAQFMYRFTAAYAAKHSHFIMFAPEILAAPHYFDKLTEYQPPLPVCCFSAVCGG